jgi:hypothetical protein
MTYAIPGSRRGRATAAAGAVCLALLTLSACEKPTPMTVVTVGSDSVNTEAACYGHGGDLSEKEMESCLGKKASVTAVVGSGEQIRFGVEPDVADTGWLLFVDGQPVLPEPLKDTYQSFPGDAFFQQSGEQGQGAPKKNAQVSIVETSGGKAKGVWHVRVEREK